MIFLKIYHHHLRHFVFCIEKPRNIGLGRILLCQ